MKGLDGGLFGGANNASDNEWFLLDQFTNSDLIAFTTYPGLIYTSPDQLPADYYYEIQLHTTKPIAFTEIGWHSAATPTGWESSENEQADFVTKFFALTSDVHPKMTIWSFLYDQNTVVPFNSMGLWRTDGTAKQAWNFWINAE